MEDKANTLTIRISEQEIEVIKRLAQNYGMTVSEYVRLSALAQNVMDREFYFLKAKRKSERIKNMADILSKIDDASALEKHFYFSTAKQAEYILDVLEKSLEYFKDNVS